MIVNFVLSIINFVTVFHIDHGFPSNFLWSELYVLSYHYVINDILSLLTIACAIYSYSTDIIDRIPSSNIKCLLLLKFMFVVKLYYAL